MTVELEERVKSTHKCEVVPVALRKHPNADSLSIVDVYGYTYVARTEDWQGVTRAAWCPPDTLVDTTRPEFTFLAKDAKFAADNSKGGPFARIKAKKLRGIVSFGLLVPVSSDIPLGTDMAESLGVSHYDPPMNTGGKKGGFFGGGEVAAAPTGVYPKYDVDAFQRYAQEVFVPGETVWVSEKIHGANARFLYVDGEFHCGSRAEWKKEFASPPVYNEEALIANGVPADRLPEIKAKMEAFETSKTQNMWWKVLRNTPALQEFLQKHEGITVYGEIYGSVQDLRYGAENGETWFAGFDMWNSYTQRWLDVYASYDLAMNHSVPWVPVLHTEYKYDFDELVTMSQGNTLAGKNPKQIREGIVVKPLAERWHPSCGRVQLKIVNPAYLER